MTNPDARSRDSVIIAALLVVTAVAAGLRFWNITGGLPYALDVDEPQIAERAVRMLRTGQFHPHFFDYPSLCIYMQFLVALGRFLMGAALGQYAGLGAFTSADLYPWARACSAALGALTVSVTFAIGRRYGMEAALTGAALLAVFPTHVRESHYALTDIPMTLLVTVTWLAALRASEVPSIKAFAMAGAAAGLAAAAKYNGALAILLPLSAALSVTDRPRFGIKAAATSCAAALMAFLSAAPYTVLDLPAFLDRFATLNREYFYARGTPSPWLLYLKHLKVSLHWPGMLLLAVGVLLALYGVARGPRRVIWLLPLLIIAPNFWLISSRTLVYARYLLPMVPALCLLAGVALVDVSRRIRALGSGWPSIALVTLLVVVTFAAPLKNVFGFNRGLGRPTTARAAYEWLQQHVPRGTPLAIENAVLVMPNDFYPVLAVPRLTDVRPDAYREKGVRYLIVSSERFGDGAGQVKPAYDPYFVMGREVFTADPSREVDGPEIRIYDIEP